MALSDNKDLRATIAILVEMGERHREQRAAPRPTYSFKLSDYRRQALWPFMRVPDLVIHDEHIYFTEGVTMENCKLPPSGWTCSREAGHPGPCSASPPDLERMNRYRSMFEESFPLKRIHNFAVGGNAWGAPTYKDARIADMFDGFVRGYEYAMGGGPTNG